VIRAEIEKFEEKIDWFDFEDWTFELSKESQRRFNLFGDSQNNAVSV